MLTFLFVRDLKLRFQQTIIGVAWIAAPTDHPDAYFYIILGFW